MVSVFTTACLATLVLSTTAALPDCSSEAKSLKDYCAITWNNHVFHAASSAPIAHSLPPAATADVRFFASQMSEITTLALKKRTAESLPTHCLTPWDLSPERKVQRSWLSSSTKFAFSLDLPPIQSHCLTRVVQARAPARVTTSHLRAFTEHLAAGARWLSAIARAGSGPFERIIASWPSVVGDVSASYLDDVYKCHVWGVVGVRARGHWGVHVKMTNADVYTTMSEGGRQYLREIIGLDRRGRLGAMRVSAWREGGIRVNDTTTTLAHWGGRPQVSEFFQLPVRDTPALKQILDVRSKDRDLVQDTVFGSNVAILALPIFMTLIPVSAVDYVDKPLVVLYAMITDVFSTLPLLVKGIELLVLRDVEGCESWVQGVEAEDPQSTAIIETWCASCAARASFRRYGYAFVASALFFMMVGLTTEWVVRQRVEFRMKNGKKLPRRYWSWNQRKGDEDSSSSSSRDSFEACGKCACGDRMDVSGEQRPVPFDRSRRFMSSGNLFRG